MAFTYFALSAVVCVVLGELGHSTEAAKILSVFPFPAKSHHRVFHPIVRALALRGHNVTCITPFPMEDPPPNYREILVHDFLDEIKEKIDFRSLNKIWTSKASASINNMISLIDERILQSQEFKDLLGWDEGFDAVIESSIVMQEPLAALEHKFRAVGIVVLPLGSSHWTNFLTGNPTNPAYMPDVTSPFTDRMSFAQRLANTLIHLVMTLFPWTFHLPRAQERADRYFRYPGWEERPSLAELMACKSLVLVNSHFTTSYAAPNSPHVIDIGGISIQPEKPLPKDIQEYMDGAEDGVIYFSLGSNMDVSKFLRGDLLRNFARSLGKLKQRVLWKWEEEHFPDQPDNVMASKWFPQNDILRHKNCKLFITHGGYMSLTEAVDSGVPVVGIPLFGDQWKNLQYASTNHFGLMIEPDNITETSISWAINTVLTDPTYREAAKARSRLFRDRPMSPTDTAVYWIEYVIRHRGAPHLRTALNKLPWYQSVLLDVMAFIIFVSLLVLWTIKKFLRWAIGLVYKKKTNGTSKKKGQ